MDRPIQRRPGLKLPKAVVITLAAALVVVAGVFLMTMAGGAKSSVRAKASNVSIAVAEQGVFRDFLTLRARLVPRDLVYLDALEGGQVQEVLAHAGDDVVVGQPIVRLRNTELELEVLDREGRLVESITQLQAYEKQLEDGRVSNAKTAEHIQYEIVRLTRAAQRSDQLLEKGFVSPAANDTVHDELAYNRRLLPLQLESNREQERLRTRQLPQIRSELASLRQSLQITRTKLDNLVVRAPVAGRLADINLTVGEIRNRGARLAQVVPDTGFKLQADVDEYYLSRIRPGQPAEVTVNGQSQPAHVVRFDPQVKNSTFMVELAFDGPTPEGLLAGQALEGQITLGSDRPGLLLPTGAYLESTGGDWVMVVRPDGGRAERRRIKTGRRNTEQIEVLSGLKPGEKVITSDYTAFAKVEQVKLAK